MATSAKNSSDNARLLARAVLIVVFLLFLIRLVGFVARFGGESLQMDFAAYYAAGQSAQAGLSPYLNHVEHDPPIWDGVNVFRHSRFLYPPLVAEAFRVLTVVPYHVAKFLWMSLSLAALFGALVLAVRLARPEFSRINLLILGFVTCWFYPVLTLLERGQVDAFTLLLVMGALTMMKPRRARSSFAAGALLALATLIKLNCVFVLPFLLVRRRWRVVVGFIVAGVVLLGLDLAVSGPGQVADYTMREMPRISAHGEGGTREMALSNGVFREVMSGVEPGKTSMDGRHYSASYFRFVLNAGLVQAWPGNVARKTATAIGLPAPRLSQLAGFFVAAFFLAFLAWQRRRGLSSSESWAGGELPYWSSVLTVILLCGPVTWAMSTVWLLVVVPLILRELPRLRNSRHVVSVFACTLGVLIVGAPDPYGFFMMSPFGQAVLNGKYVVGELVCLAGLMGLWKGDD